MRLILIILFSVLALPATAQCVGENLIESMTEAERAAFDQKVAAAPYNTGNFWRAQKGDSSIYVLGTIHLDDPRLAKYLEPVWPIIKKADLILLEGTREDMKRLEKEMASKPDMMFITDGPTLPERLPKADWAKLRDAMSERGIPGFLAAKMQPWYISMMLSIPPCAMNGLAEKNGVDFRIMDFAEKNGIPTRGLEPYDTVLSIFGGDKPDEETDMIRMALANANSGGAMIVTMMDSYLSGMHRAIWELNRQHVLADPNLEQEGADKMFAEMESKLLTSRNLNWTDAILSAAAKNATILVAVGAAHLSGKTGVLYQLEQNGYALTRVNGF